MKYAPRFLRLPRAVVALLLALALAGCSTSVQEYNDMTTNAIGSATGVNFQPPVGSDPTLGNFDPNVSMVIKLFALDANGAVTENQVGPTFATSDGTITVTNEPGVEEHYQVNLDTSLITVDDGTVVRVEIRTSNSIRDSSVCGGHTSSAIGCLAFFDLELWPNQGKAKKSRASDGSDETIIDLVDGQTIPIKVHVAQGAVPASSLVAYWSFNECSAVDDSGNLHDGTVYEAVCVDGDFGKAYDFDGTDDRIMVANDPALVMNDAFTVAGWVKAEGAGSGGPNANYGTLGGIILNKEGEYEIARFADGTIKVAVGRPDGTWDFFDTGITIALDNWVHVAWTWDTIDTDSSVTNLFINGVAVWSASYDYDGAIGDTITDKNDLWIGGRQGISQYFDGLIDEVALFDSALSNGDIAALHAAY